MMLELDFDTEHTCKRELQESLKMQQECISVSVCCALAQINDQMKYLV